MKQMLRMELYKALKNKLFYISIVIGCIITIFSFVYNLGMYQNELLMRNTAEANPMYAASSLFNLWMGGEPFSLGTSVYFFVFPLLVTIPYGWSYCEEKQCGYIRMVTVRSGKTAYFLSKYVAVFLSGGLAMVIPLVFNFLLSAMFFPAVMPMPIYCTTNGIFFDSLLSMLYYSKPFLYVLIYLCIDFLFSGLIACLSYGAASFVKHRAVTVILPLFLLLAVHYSRQFVYTSQTIRYKEISPMFFLRPVGAVYPASWLVIIVELAVLFLITFFLSMAWERRHEVY